MIVKSEPLSLSLSWDCFKICSHIPFFSQQRVFAVQVFELHRLIKVQKLFAGSPDLALDVTSFPEKTLKSSIPKQISLEFAIKPPTNIENHKENNLNDQKTEASAENAVAKSSISSSQNISHHQPPLPSNPQPTPVTTQPNTNPWHPNQPGGQHWLVPIMSPTEGLIYKPYPGPAYAGSNPTINNFPNYNNPYGIIPNNSHPPFQVPPGFPSMSHHGYFMPYAMSAPMGPAFSGSEVDQGNNHFNGPIQKRKSDETDFGNAIMSEERELQVSTGSGPRGERNRPRFFQSSRGDDVARENRTRVIKVVPHNAMSANETAFRIFQSIQREREQNESL